MLQNDRPTHQKDKNGESVCIFPIQALKSGTTQKGNTQIHIVFGDAHLLLANIEVDKNQEIHISLPLPANLTKLILMDQQ